MQTVYSRPKSLKKAPFHYCPGCGHSVIHRLICEVIDEMNLQDRTIGVPPPEQVSSSMPALNAAFE